MIKLWIQIRLQWFWGRLKAPYLCECGNIIRRDIAYQQINANLAREDMACIHCLQMEDSHDYDDYDYDYEEPDFYGPADEAFEQWELGNEDYHEGGL